ncbi:ArsR family transcriptional regulator [Ligilactobacillus salivarius]|uniref:ArsR/SmtB family transcription factor n=1 Tax=Ligilactobacillus salivarius TaxID=1624 RepID=UPI000E445D92|nr:metalloregulator ArsR/SmtB family transcription factor [Ligilactobacillus salivarius]RGM23355.1 ArsR family transcriptional regulator [Ligilactobacillus salivarius]
MSVSQLSKVQNEALDNFVENFDIINALADRNRQKIIVLLFGNLELESGMTVTAITNNMSITQPAVSHHLKILRDSGIVAYRKDGLQSYYYLTLQEPLEKLENISRNLRLELEE